MNVWLMTAAVILDQVIKSLIRRLPRGFVFFRADHVVEIIHSQNTGVAFSMLSGYPLVVLLCSAALLLGIALYVPRGMRLRKPAKIAFSILLGGGMGNLIDRLLYASVTDYVHLLFLDFPIFNLADVMITVSIAVIVYLLLSNRLEEVDTNGTKH